MKLGWIGTGIMGSRMAANLLKHGNDVVAYNRTKTDAAASRGCAAASAVFPGSIR